MLTELFSLPPTTDDNDLSEIRCRLSSIPVVCLSIPKTVPLLGWRETKLLLSRWLRWLCIQSDQMSRPVWQSNETHNGDSQIEKDSQGRSQCLKITEKVSFNIASYAYILSGQELIKIAKNMFGILKENENASEASIRVPRNSAKFRRMP